jgi:hypothetical protein
MVLPADLVRPVECLAQNMFISAPHIFRATAEAASGCQAELQAADMRKAARRLWTCDRPCPNVGGPGARPLKDGPSISVIRVRCDAWRKPGRHC